MKWAAPLLAVALLAGCGSTYHAQAEGPLGVDYGGADAVSSSSSLFGDGSSGQEGTQVGCIDGRHLVVTSSIRNRTRHAITLTGSPRVELDSSATRVGVGFELRSPSSPNGPPDPPLDWSTHGPTPLVLPAGRAAWIESSISMSHCALLDPHQWSSFVGGEITLEYRSRGTSGTQAVSSVPIALRPGPTHPKVPVNQPPG
jgi:hypothetical protein